MKYKRRSVPTPKYQADVSSLVHEPWYHGDISWEDAEERLEAQDSDCFLVRKSQSQPGEYVLSVSFGRIIKDFGICIRKESQCYEVEGAEKQFSSLEELVAFYKDHYLTVDGMTLTTPCPPPRLKPIPHKQIHQTGKRETCSSPELTLLVLSQTSSIQYKIEVYCAAIGHERVCIFQYHYYNSEVIQVPLNKT